MDSEQLAESLGLNSWVCPGDGIGGLLKVRVEDFRVEEEADVPALDPKGRFTIARITLTDWETNRFVNRLARALKMSRNRIWFSGTKDKRAITTQLFVIDAHQQKVEEVQIKDVEIEVLGRSHQKVKMGDHSSNRFTITIRGCAEKDGSPMEIGRALEEIEMIRSQLKEKLGEGRFPNWVGPQRFGATRPVTPVVGRHVVNGDFESAVNQYLGMAGLNEMEPVANFRSLWRESGDVEAAIEAIPQHLGYEMSMLNSLKSRPDDWVSAFRKLPNNLQLMMVHSLQSMAFNHALGARIENGLSITLPVEGDVVGPVGENGKINTGKLSIVTSETKPRISRNCLLGRLAVTGTLPGSEGTQPVGAMADIESKVFERLELSELDWHVKAIPRLTTKGTRRALAGYFSDFAFEEVSPIDLTESNEKWEKGPSEGDRWNPDGCCIRFRFSLPPGTYATTLLREFTRAPLHQS
jgi:tRNA pseudouridine13 synthase